MPSIEKLTMAFRSSPACSLVRSDTLSAQLVQNLNHGGLIGSSAGFFGLAIALYLTFSVQYFLKSSCQNFHGSIKYKQVKLHKNSVVRLANAVFTIIRSYLYLPMQVAFFFAIQENSGSVGSDTLNAFLLAIMLSIAVLLSVYALSTRIAIHFVVDTPSRLANASSFCFSSSESLTPTCFFVSAIRFSSPLCSMLELFSKIAVDSIVSSCYYQCKQNYFFFGRC